MMFWSRRLPTTDLIELARALRYTLSSGLMLRDAMDLVANKGTRQMRPVAAGIARDLKGGWSLQEALDKQKSAFPPLFLALTNVGEESGHLPEVMGEIEQYYELQRKLRREFVSEITWPIVQLIFAVLIIAGLIMILGIVQPPAGPLGHEPLDPLGLGLLGAEGALAFLAIVGGAIVGVWLLFAILRFALRGTTAFEWTLLHVPALGPCLYAMCLMRFCVALRLMMDTNVSIMKTMRLALLSTDNVLFVRATPVIENSLRSGNSIANSMAAARIFPASFLSIFAVAEETGRISDTLTLQAREYDEFARRRLAFLNRLASWLIWLGIAIVMVAAIFRIFLKMYYGPLSRVLDQTMGGGGAP